MERASKESKPMCWLKLMNSMVKKAQPACLHKSADAMPVILGLPFSLIYIAKPGPEISVFRRDTPYDRRNAFQRKGNYEGVRTFGCRGLGRLLRRPCGQAFLG